MGSGFEPGEEELAANMPTAQHGVTSLGLMKDST